MSELCRVCESDNISLLFTGTLLNDEVSYFECAECGYVQTQEPHWLDRAYAKPINDTDVGIMVRNLGNVKIVLSSLIVLGCRNGKVIDNAGGYGILTRMLRDHGVNAFWSDPYCPNLIAKGFEQSGDVRGSLVTCFEAFEHFVHPVVEMERLLDSAPNILLSTELIETPAPRQENWYYYGHNHGQHIGFFRLQTLEKLAKHFGKYLISDGHSYHLFSDKKVNKNLWHALTNIGRINPKLLSLRMRNRINDIGNVFNL